jgi:hypothetical protein
MKASPARLAQIVAWKKRNPIRVRAANIKCAYGITVSEVEAMRVLQSGVCALCRLRPSNRIDHDHTTGKVRGLLCNSCNTALGSYEKILAEVGALKISAYLNTAH